MACHFIVVVKEVWDTRDLVGEVLDDAGSIKAGALTTRFEPEDLNALEMALRVKDEHGGKVTVLSVGVPRDVDVLRECMYRGVDEVRRITADPCELDAQATAALLAGAVRTLGEYTMILTGTTIVDEQNSLLGVHLAAELGIEHVSWIDSLEEIDEERAVGKRAIEMGYEYVQVAFPALFSVGVALLEDDPRAPRSAKAMLKLKMKKKPIPELAPADLDAADPAASATTARIRLEPVEQRIIESKEVDPEDEAALKTMLDEVLKGE